jgi:hypothetical protein
MNVKVTTRYQADIFFEADDEQEVENTLTLQALSPDPELADWTLSPGSPASAPYVTIAGPSRAWVQKIANLVYATLEQLGVRFIK